MNILLKRALVSMLKEMFAYDNEVTPDTTGRAFNVFPDAVPIHDDQDADDIDDFNYIVVKPSSGSQQTRDDYATERIDLYIGVYSEAYDGSGNEILQEAMERIIEHFSANVILNERYMSLMPIEWALDNEDRYPYYFGMVSLTFSVPTNSMEDDDYV